MNTLEKIIEYTIQFDVKYHMDLHDATYDDY